jgi:23S rRNA pseudouridine955/2504/2580 synthase/23S rRNA pseudouridine1911/1915/1917 synthase
MIKAEELILFENNDFVIVNKPSGLLTIPDREAKEISIKKILQSKVHEVFTVHRIDKVTSGIVVFAKNQTMHRHLSMLFEKRKTKKIYEGLVLGTPANNTGTINQPISEHPAYKGVMTVHRKGKESITEYEVVENFKLFSWMKFTILTGRTHQIRVHMKHIGHPLACDELYGDAKPVFISQLKHKYKLSKSEEEEKPIINRLTLHASELSFTGINNELFHFQAPLPKDLRAVFKQLQKWKN